ncbi:MAG: O-methyltransferase [Nitrosopumilus sp.]|nr:O-methyltransferase [Nitrosopumilus sp.]
MVDFKIDNVLKRIEDQEKFEQENPHDMLNSEKVLAIGRNTGIFYNILLQSISAKKILEIGMSVGYSTIWFAEAIKKNPNGKIITIDQNKKKIERAKKNFNDAGVSDLIEIRIGDALEVLSEINDELNSSESLDFVFIDADKERYTQYFDAVIPLVKPGGLIGADNILYPKRFQKFTNLYVNHVRKKQNIRSVTIPIDNGEELSIKLS